MDIILDIQNPNEIADLPSNSDFNLWVKSALIQSGFNQECCEITIRVVDEAESQALNNEYRGKDKPTNVLSFPFEAPPPIESDLLGDLVICHAVMAKEAKEQTKAVSDHWAHLVIHGVLHLLGFDHIEEDEAQVMEALEVKILALMNINDPYKV